MIAPEKNAPGPTLTVVVPSYNQEDTIEQTLKSILEHNDPNGLEVLVFDSLSNDRTPEVLRRWETRATIFREKDQGQSDAIDRGFKMAKGEILTWLNTDDVFYPGALDRARKLFLENPDADIISGKGTILDRCGNFQTAFPEGPFLDDRGLRYCNLRVLQPSVFFTRKILERAKGIDPDLRYVMDWDLWCRFINAGAHWKLVDDFFSAARFYPETKTGSGGLPRFRERLRIARKHMKPLPDRYLKSQIKTWGLESAPKPISLLTHWLYRIKSYLREGTFKEYHEVFEPLPNAGTTEIRFPWYQGKVSVLVFQLQSAGRKFNPVPITIRCDDLENTFQLNGGKNRFELKGPFDQTEFVASLSTAPGITYRILEVAPTPLK